MIKVFTEVVFNDRYEQCVEFMGVLEVEKFTLRECHRALKKVYNDGYGMSSMFRDSNYRELHINCKSHHKRLSSEFGTITLINMSALNTFPNGQV